MIELLPPHIANQIAAGEVVQRGASIVKELVENAVDAGAARVVIRVEDGGRTLISVVDDGGGMSFDDARKSFLRHATSKIRTAEDLFSLHTFGFRGEALASIASVAEVEMRTRREQDEIGTQLIVRDTKEMAAEECAAAVGTSLVVRNLFYSIPARRKFLKSDAYEAKLCRVEFMRIALVNESVAFEYTDNTSVSPTILVAQNLHNRIVALTRQSYAKKLLAIDVDSPIVRLKGYVGTPDTAKSNGRADQFLFVNGRFFRNARIFRSVCDAYGRLLASGSSPAYFLYLEVAPDKVDVNINPTKTEVKFEDEDAIWQIISSAVKKTLGQANIVEAIDFEPSSLDIPSFNPSRPFVKQPTAAPDRPYNPFALSDWDVESKTADFDAQAAPFREYIEPAMAAAQSAIPLQSSFAQQMDVATHYVGFQFASNRLIATHTVDGLAIVNVARARQRVAYEEAYRKFSANSLPINTLSIGVEVELSAESKADVLNNIDKYESLGFSIADNSGSSLLLLSMPDGFSVEDFVALIEADVKLDFASRAAQIATHNILQESPPSMSTHEVALFLERLMSCDEPSYTPTGLKIIEIIEVEELEKRMKR